MQRAGREHAAGRAWILALALLAGACASPVDVDQQQLDRIPEPSTDADRQQKCAWLAGELAAQRKRVEGSPESDADPGAAAARGAARGKIHLLEMRADDFHCGSVTPDPNVPALTVPPWLHATPPLSAPVPVAPPPRAPSSQAGPNRSNQPGGAPS